MQNKPNFGNDKMNITLDMTSNYMVLSALRGQKTNPIQTQFKANKAKNKPNLSQNKPNQTQFLQKRWKLCIIPKTSTSCSMLDVFSYLLWGKV